MPGGRTKPCGGMAVVRILTWILFPRHPLMAVDYEVRGLQVVVGWSRDFLVAW